METPLDEVAFLANSENRVNAIRSLARGPRTRHELVEETDASRPTIARIVGEFEDRNWITRSGRQYELTPVGRLVEAAMTELLDTMEAELKLREAVRWLPVERIEVDLAAFSDAVVSVPEPSYSHQPVNRFVELLEAADTARGFGIATLAPTSATTLFRKASAGMTAEIIYPRPVLEAILTANPAIAAEAVESGNLTAMVHDDLPCSLYLFDDRVVLGGYNRDTGVLRVVVDTDEPAAFGWAETIYERYRSEARPFDPADVCGSE